MSNILTRSNKNNSVEILCIGTEILLGNILNSNAKWLSEELYSIGLSHYRQTVVGDNCARVKEAIIEASKRCRYLITTGGLGPTPDDLTTEAIAAAFNCRLHENPAIWMDIQQKLTGRNCLVPEINRKQALLPIDAEIIPNLSGTAPGIIWSPIDDFTILTFPGVPSEMKEMWLSTAIPWFKKNEIHQGYFASKVLHFSGIKESILAELLSDLLEKSNPTIAPYASIGEVRLRITAKSKNLERAQDLIKPVEKEILKRTGAKFFGSNNESLASVVIQLLRDRKETICVAESCTGGGIGATLTTIPGSSDVFVGGIIAYNNSIKQKLLEVPPTLLKEFGAVSIPVVEAMATGALKKLSTTWCISVSGIAGPTGESSEKPIGLVDFCIAGPDGIKSYENRFNSNRTRIEIQRLSILRALDELRLLLLNKS